MLENFDIESFILGFIVADLILVIITLIVILLRGTS
jgi:hypothetical protein